MGRWSVAYRLHDAQFWGVPQRRKRIALVADFGGLSAPEILFERKGMSWYPQPGEEAGQGTSTEIKGSTRSASCYGLDHVMLSGGTTYQGRGYYDNVSGCLKTQPYGVCETFSIDKAITTGGNCTAGGDCIHSEYTPALTTDRPHAVLETISFQERGGKPGGGKEREVICQCFQNTGQGWWNESEIGATIRTPCGGDSAKANLVAAVDCRNGVEDPELNASSQSSAAHNINSNNVLRQGGIVRRLTPLECERLQGFPDGWTDIGEWTDTKGRVHKPADSPRYKALGNSIAVGYANNKSGFWMWMLKRISAQYERAATLGSLFDGIGGFPLAWETFNGKGSAVWASEIEEFAIAVTKLRFPEEE
jgi:DNA (cytosine-5)-methyltransferase 1